MNRNQINGILAKDRKRCWTIIIRLLFAVAFAAIAIYAIVNYVLHTRNYYVSYTETSDIDYDVEYLDNDYFVSKQKEGKQYIAGLIKSINADFAYDIDFEDKSVQYDYAYRIEANTVVQDKTSGKAILDNTETIVDEIKRHSNDNTLHVLQNVEIDYAKYNQLVEKVLSTYGLDSVESFLNVNMYVKVTSSCEDFSNDEESEHVVTLNIPLSKKTVGINLKNVLSNSTDNVLLCRQNNFFDVLILIMGILFAISSIILFITTTRYYLRTRSAQNIYAHEFKRIISNYGPYIQQSSSPFALNDARVVAIKNFNDMLEIRDTVRQPIIMFEDVKKCHANFYIPTNNKIVYFYRLSADGIKSKINKNEKKINVDKGA